MFNCAKYLCGESEEVFIPIPANINITVAMSRIKSHAHRMRRKTKCELIYACHKDGEGLRLVRVLLDEPIKKKQRGRPKGVKNKPAPLELLDYIAKAGDDFLPKEI